MQLVKIRNQRSKLVRVGTSIAAFLLRQVPICLGNRKILSVICCRHRQLYILNCAWYRNRRCTIPWRRRRTTGSTEQPLTRAWCEQPGEWFQCYVGVVRGNSPWTPRHPHQFANERCRVTIANKRRIVLSRTRRPKSPSSADNSKRCHPSGRSQDLSVIRCWPSELCLVLQSKVFSWLAKKVADKYNEAESDDWHHRS